MAYIAPQGTTYTHRVENHLHTQGKWSPHIGKEPIKNRTLDREVRGYPYSLLFLALSLANAEPFLAVDCFLLKQFFFVCKFFPHANKTFSITFLRHGARLAFVYWRTPSMTYYVVLTPIALCAFDSIYPHKTSKMPSFRILLAIDALQIKFI